MIRLQDITKIYRTGAQVVRALDSVSLQIEAGSWVAIMGASGSGKSTMMNVLGCLDRADAGCYLLAGRDISDLSADELARVRNSELGFVFQSFNLLPHGTALDNVVLPLIYAGERDRRVRALAALERVGLAERAGHRPSELSGGQRQRVAIARALVTAPSVILADEPTGNLDSHTSDEILALFCDLHREGATIVMVTHELDVGQRAQRIIEFRDGRIVADQQTARARGLIAA